MSLEIKYLDDCFRLRQANAEYYDKKLKKAGLTEKGIVKTPVPVCRAGGDKIVILLTSIQSGQKILTGFKLS